MTSQPCRNPRGLSLTVMNILRSFSDHPASVGESYFGHLAQATAFGLRMLFAGIACILHGLLPFLFVSTGSDAMKALHAEMSARRERALRSGVTIR